MTSYIKILQKLDAFCAAHLQIKKFMGEFREQMPNFSTLNEKYPVVFATPVSDIEDLNTNQFTLEIYCVDIIQKDRANLNTIVSDCHLILKDLFIYYRDDNDAELDVVGTASISFVNNFDLDYVAGAVMTITFEVAGYGSCEIPMSPITPVTNECEPAILIVRDTDDNILYTLTVDSGDTANQIIQDSTYIVEYENGTPIESGSILAEGSAVIQVPNPIVCADATYEVEYENGTPITSGSIPSGGFQLIQVPNPIVCADATYNLDNTEGSTLFLGSIPSGDNETIIAPDGTANVKNTAGTTVATGLVPSGGSANITAPDGTVQINGDQVATVASGGMVNVAVENESGTPIGAFDGDTGVWVVPNCQDATVENSNATYTDTVPSGGTLVLPDTDYDIYVNGLFNTTVSLPTLDTNTINITN
jgi:hypothetical protein